MNSIDQFLNNNCDTKATKDNYKSGLRLFFRTLNIDPDEYIKTKRDYDEDIMIFWRELQNYAPMTRRARISIVKQFLEENEINLSNKTKKKLRRKIKGTRAVTLDVIPTNQELKQILSHGETKARALGLLASSSGMRLNEILQLTVDDIDFNHDPVKIYVRAETSKFEIARIVFCSNEAADAIKSWLKERSQYLNTAVARCGNLTGKSLDDDTIFCFTESNANKIWSRLLKKSGFDQIDKTTGIYRMHFYVLRKFFETRMSYAGVQEAIYQQLQGHTGYLNGSYKRFTEQELGESYKKGVKSLLVFETQPDLTETNQEITKLQEESRMKDKQIQELEKKIDEINQTMLLLLAKNQK